MNHSAYDTMFEQYLTDIVLTKSQADSIDAMLGETLSLFMAEFDDVDIYAQGSYAMGTTVRPLTVSQSPQNQAGEYDVDIVLDRVSWAGARGSLESVRNVLSNEYKDKLDIKLRETCERVNHAVDENTDVAFHVDYVPIKSDYPSKYAPRRTNDVWFSSNTKHLVEWFASVSSSNTFLPSQILILKRIRDNAGYTDVISSICITALVCNLYEDKQSYAGDLLNIIDGIITIFNVAHEDLAIKFEPLEDDLADRISVTQHAAILKMFRDVRTSLGDGLNTGDSTKIRAVLSDSFPAEKRDYPDNLEALRRRGWGIETDGSLHKSEIIEHAQKGTAHTRVWRKFIGTGEPLKFEATSYDKSSYGIRWQVLNAASSPQRRGDLFEARSVGGGKNSNEFVNHETESYSGKHWIKYFVYNKVSRRVVEIGEKFFVEVE